MKAVGFDLDETLATTARDRATILAEASERADGPDLSREEYLQAHAAHSGDASREPVFDALLDDRDTDATAGELAAAYRTAIEESLEPIPGAVGLLEGLRSEYRVGLLTDGPVDAQRAKLAALGWTDLFDATVVTGALGEPKPDPGAFAALADALDVPVEAVVYVGDHPENDVAGAAAAGMAPVQVRYEGGPDSHRAAVATVRRECLVADLPGIVARL